MGAWEAGMWEDWRAEKWTERGRKGLSGREKDGKVGL